MLASPPKTRTERESMLLTPAPPRRSVLSCVLLLSVALFLQHDTLASITLLDGGASMAYISMPHGPPSRVADHDASEGFDPLLAEAMAADDEAHRLSIAPPRRCDFAVVGGGWAGVYTAWRLTVDSGHLRGDQVCIFEASARWGGRTVTVREGDLNLDIGAYRFDNTQHLPADLIYGPLNLTSRCYLDGCEREPDEFNLTLRVLVDRHTGEAAGYITPIEEMLRSMRAIGVATYLEQRLSAVHDALDGEMQLVWSDGLDTVCKAVMLNLPRNALLSLDARSIVFSRVSPVTARLLRCTNENEPDEIIKVYALYEEAWWRTWLGLRGGIYYPAPTPTGPQLFIRYHVRWPPA